MDPPSVYLISGPPASGRSEVARLLAARFERGVHLDAGELRQLEAVVAAVDERFGAGDTVVIEATVAPSFLGDYRTMIRGRPCHVVVLDEPGGGPQVGIWLDTAELTPYGAVDEILARTSSVREPIVVVDYDEAWPAYFEEISGPVRAAVADLGAEVEHVGSTSVPGLAAKPVIDVDVVVRDVDDVPVAIERLCALGYVYQGDKGIRGREAFLWPPGARRHHLYVVVARNPPHLEHVRFRDYLQAHPDVARDYADLKRRLAAEHSGDPIAYTDAKTDFVTGVLRDAGG